MAELTCGILNVLIYFALAVAVLLTLRALVKIYDELFRKMLHFVLLGSLAVWTVSFSTWWLEALTALGFAVVVYPVLMVFEKLKKYSEFTTERTKGELKSSLLAVFSMFALVITVTEGIFKDRYLAIASLYAWGVGDAFAALVGKKYGRHKIKGRYLTGEKSLEGTFAMFISAFLSVLIILLIRGGMSVPPVAAVSLVTAAASAVTELYTKNGMDTVTCPLVSMAVLLITLYAAGGL